MKKIYLIAAGAFLILLIIISMFLSFGKKSTTDTQKGSLFPTNIPHQGSVNQGLIDQRPNPQNNQASLNTVSQTENGNGQNLSDSTVDISIIKPLETEDFKLQYSSKVKKIIVEKKTPQAEEQFINWANQNQLASLIENPNLISIVNLGKNPDDFNPLIEFLNIFKNLGQGIGSSPQNPTPSLDPSFPTPNPNLSSIPNPPSSNFTYYAQCGDQGGLPLPDGCTLCYAGCGPTSVSMIASSYLSKDYDPKAIVDLYKSKSYLLGCSGSRYTDARELLGQLGLKTTDYLVFNGEKSDTVVPQLREYLKAGWTFFTLASFCDGGCGHFFWITDIDNQGNIFAYDPAYGRYQIPYNENSRYPFPLYRLAFGVKK